MRSKISLLLFVLAASLSGVVAASGDDLKRAPATAPVTPVQHTVLVEGHPITVWEKKSASTGQTVLLVHGRTWSALPDFDLQVPGLQLSLMDGLVEQGYAAYAIDLRGYGQTPRDTSGWLTPNRAADDVAAVLRWIAASAITNTRPHLFGWSMGSTVAQLSVQRHPELASSLTLFGYWRDVDALLPADEPGIEPVRALNTAEAAASDFIVPGSISDEAVQAYVKAALAADPVRADIRHVYEYNSLNEARITLPTLVIAGQFDPLAPMERQARLFTRLGTGHKQLVSVPGGDHAAFLESPRAYFLHSLISFWQSIELAPVTQTAEATP